MTAHAADDSDEYRTVVRQILMATIGLRGHQQGSPSTPSKPVTHAVAASEQLASLLTTALPELPRRTSLHPATIRDAAVSVVILPGTETEPTSIQRLVVTTRNTDTDDPGAVIYRKGPTQDASGAQVLENIHERSVETHMDDISTILRDFRAGSLSGLKSVLDFVMHIVRNTYPKLAARLLKIRELWYRDVLEILDGLSEADFSALPDLPWTLDVFVMETVAKLDLCGIPHPPRPSDGSYRYSVTRDDIPKWISAVTSTCRKIEAALLIVTVTDGNKRLYRLKQPPSPDDILTTSVQLNVLHGLLGSGFLDRLLKPWEMRSSLRREQTMLYIQCVSTDNQACSHKVPVPANPEVVVVSHTPTSQGDPPQRSAPKQLEERANSTDKQKDSDSSDGHQSVATTDHLPNSKGQADRIAEHEALDGHEKGAVLPEDVCITTETVGELLVRQLKALAGPVTSARSLIGHLYRLRPTVELAPEVHYVSVPCTNPAIGLPPRPSPALTTSAIRSSSPVLFSDAARDAFVDEVIGRMSESDNGRGWSRKKEARDWLFRRFLDTPVSGLTAAEAGHRSPREKDREAEFPLAVHPEAAMMGLACVFSSRERASSADIRIQQPATGGTEGDKLDVCRKPYPAAAEAAARDALECIFSVCVSILARATWLCIADVDIRPQTREHPIGLPDGRTSCYCCWQLRRWLNKVDRDWFRDPYKGPKPSDEPNYNWYDISSRPCEQSAGRPRPECPSFLLPGSTAVVYPWVAPDRSLGVPLEFLRELLEELTKMLAYVAQQHVDRERPRSPNPWDWDYY